MIIGGLQKFSLLDYPEHISAIIFTKGCNFRCQFCYNPMLVWPDIVQVGKVKNTSSSEEGQNGHPLSEDDLFVFLKSRINKLDAVVITGGEPTLHKDLPEFIKKIRKLGFKIKLDTNGTSPEMLKKLLKNSLLDYIAMDIKASTDKYKQVTGVNINLSKIRESIIIIKTSGLPYEFRSTLVPGLVGKQDIENMGNLIKGAEKWFLQQFKPDTDLVNQEYQKTKPYSAKELEQIKAEAQKYVKKCEIR